MDFVFIRICVELINMCIGIYAELAWVIFESVEYDVDLSSPSPPAPEYSSSSPPAHSDPHCYVRLLPLAC
jgi:hypothetical protein